MKPIFYILLIQLFIISCEHSKEIKSNTEKSSETSRIEGNAETEKRFNDFKNVLIVEEDSLREINFLNQKFNEVKCESRFFAENDYDNQTEKIFIREYSLTISDSIELRVLQKQDKISEYIYTYQGKPFKVKNFYGEMFSKNSDLFFVFDNRKCYKISNNRYLMREQPMAWCGLANRFDIFQIIDLEKMTLIQFADRDEKLN